MNYRRSKATGATFFFTVVTHLRRKILRPAENMNLLRQAFQSVNEKYPFQMDAFVVLPDHVHCIWTLPEGDNDFSTRWRLIKSYFTKRCRSEEAIWQKRFWEHQIRDDEDFARHVEYIHYNPVRHGYVESPLEWPHSSFHAFVGRGIYHPSWGAGEKMEFDARVGSE